MKWFKIGKRFISGNAFRVSRGLGLSLPLLLVGPAALATLDLGPTADSAAVQMGTETPGGEGSLTSPDVTINDASPHGNPDTIVNGDVEGALAIISRWRMNGTQTRVQDSIRSAIGRRPTIFRQLPLRRDPSAIVSPGPANDTPVPEPSTVVAACLLVLPLGVGALGSVRNARAIQRNS